MKKKITEKHLGIIGLISVAFLMASGCRNPILAPTTNGTDQVDPTSFYSSNFASSTTMN